MENALYKPLCMVFVFEGSTKDLLQFFQNNFLNDLKK